MLHRIVQNQVGGIEVGLLSRLCAEKHRSWASLRLTLHTLSTNRNRGRESSEWTMSAIEIILPRRSDLRFGGNFIDSRWNRIQYMIR